jgi:hypothetical protein
MRRKYVLISGSRGESALAIPCRKMKRDEARFAARTELKEAEVVTYVASLFKHGFDVEVKTPTGMWRSVAVVYSDGTFGTARPREVEPGGRFTVLRANQIISVRPVEKAGHF